MAPRGSSATKPLLEARRDGDASPFDGDSPDVKSCRQFFHHAAEESKRLYLLAGPAILTALAEYSLAAVTQIFAGHLTTLELDAVSTDHLVIALLAYGIMLGMGSAVETLCGQAYGARQLHMLGIYMQRSCVILGATGLVLLPIYLYASPLLRLFGQDPEIADLAGRYALYLIPQHFACAFNFPIQKFLLAQSRVGISAWASAGGLSIHIALSWLLIAWLKMGLVGAAICLNVSWWIVVLGKLLYIIMGYCEPGSWTGFSREAFRGLGAFARLSIASAIMICLELWNYALLIVLAGHLKNPQIAVAAVSIGVNLTGWEVMVFVGFQAAISVRVSNELGSQRPRAAKFSILVVVCWSLTLGLCFFTLVLALKDVYGHPFTNRPDVDRAVSSLAVFVAFSLLLNSVQPVLTGVAVGAGWQWLVAYVNVGCYYIVGLPLGFLLGSYFDFGIQGVWCGLIAGVLLQTIILTVITLGTNWDKEAMAAVSRIRKWGGDGSVAD